jgi:hypothetical protein
MSQVANKFLAQVPADTLKGNNTGSTANVTDLTVAQVQAMLSIPTSGSPLSIAAGGTGQTTQQAALNALAGAVTSGFYLRGNGTNVLMSAIQAGDVPTLNQSTTGTAANITASTNSTLTTLTALSLPGSQVTGNISGNAANVTGTVVIANGGTGQTTANAAFDALSPMTTAGDLVYENSTPTAARLAIGSTGQILTVVSGLPAWASPATSGTVTSVSVVSANGFAGTVATATSTPAITISTTLTTPVVAANGTALIAATVTGTGSTVVLSASPTFTGTVTTAALSSTTGSFSGAVNMNGNQINNLAAGTAGTDAVNYNQLTSISTGLIWQGPIDDPDLVNDQLATPPGSPLYSIVYIIGASPTGAWTGLAGHAVWWDGFEYIDLSTGNTAASGQGTAVQVGARFLIASATPGGPALVGGSFTNANVGQIATVLTNTPGSFTWSFTTPLNNWAVSDQDIGSQHYNNSFTYVTNGPYTFTVSSANATAGATYTNNGNTFTVQTTIVSATQLLVTGTGAPTTSGTLTKSSGTGDSTITFSSYTGSNWIDFAGPSKNVAGSGLVYTGNTLNILVDNSTIDFNGSNQLEVKAGGITNTQISASAAIAFSKLAALPSAEILLGNGSNVATATAVTGDVTISNTGVTSLVATSNSTLTTLSGLTTASSLSSVGTITSGTWNGTTIAIAHGGTGATSAASAFNNLAPSTATGGLIVGSGTNTYGNLPIGSTGYVLTVVGGTAAWAATAATATNNKETFVLGSGDISNQYVTLAHTPLANSVSFLVQGGGDQLEGSSYDFVVSGAQIQFKNGLATGGVSALVSGDILQIQYEY